MRAAVSGLAMAPRLGLTELKVFGAEFGFAVEVHRAVRVHGMEVSSSAVRGLIAAGDVRRARWMLGRVFGVHSTPAKGRGVGTKLLVPTVNLAHYEGLLPGFGVYVTRLTVSGAEGDRCFQAVTNVGNRPTFEGAGFSVETHILNFAPMDLTDETPLKLEFLSRLRGERTWPSTEALKAQIFNDVTRANRYFRLGRKLAAPDAMSTPHPDSAGVFYFHRIRDVRCCKILSGKDLAAESSQERAYGRGIGCFSANRPSRGLLFPLWRNSRINLQNRAEKIAYFWSE